MTGTYILRIVKNFSAAHQLRNYVGKCARLHGHNWNVEVCVKATELNKADMIIDFDEIKAITNELIDSVDHQNLNEIPPFDCVNPSAEGLAKWFYDELMQKLKKISTTVTMQAVTIWETEKNSVTYQEVQ